MDQHLTQEANYHTTTKQQWTPSITQPIKEIVMLDLTTVETVQDITLKPVTADSHKALLQMQNTDPFCKCISKWSPDGKSPKHDANLFTHIKGLLYKHITDPNQKFMALIIPRAWKYTVLVEAHDKLGHQWVTCTYCLIKEQYSWKGMKKDIWKSAHYIIEKRLWFSHTHCR